MGEGTVHVGDVRDRSVFLQTRLIGDAIVLLINLPDRFVPVFVYLNGLPDPLRFKNPGALAVQIHDGQLLMVGCPVASAQERRPRVQARQRGHGKRVPASVHFIFPAALRQNGVLLLPPGGVVIMVGIRDGNVLFQFGHANSHLNHFINLADNRPHLVPRSSIGAEPRMADGEPGANRLFPFVIFKNHPPVLIISVEGVGFGVTVAAVNRLAGRPGERLCPAGAEELIAIQACVRKSGIGFNGVEVRRIKNRVVGPKTNGGPVDMPCLAVSFFIRPAGIIGIMNRVVGGLSLFRDLTGHIDAARNGEGTRQRPKRWFVHILAVGIGVRRCRNRSDEVGPVEGDAVSETPGLIHFGLPCFRDLIHIKRLLNGSADGGPIGISRGPPVDGPR